MVALRHQSSADLPSGLLRQAPSWVILLCRQRHGAALSCMAIPKLSDLSSLSKLLCLETERDLFADCAALGLSGAELRSKLNVVGQRSNAVAPRARNRRKEKKREQKPRRQVDRQTYCLLLLVCTKCC